MKFETLELQLNISLLNRPNYAKSILWETTSLSAEVNNNSVCKYLRMNYAAYIYTIGHAKMFVFVLDITVVVQGKMTVRQTDGDINWEGEGAATTCCCHRDQQKMSNEATKTTATVTTI